MSVIDVAVAIIRNPEGEVLINQRLGNDGYKGHWEFPGGKLEKDESAEQALIRECHEEIDIEISACSPLITFTHSYPDKTVRLHVFLVTEFVNQPRPIEGQPLKWVKIEALVAHDLLPADITIIRALQLSDYCIVTPKINSAESLKHFVNKIKVFVQRQSSFILQVRQHHMSQTRYIDFFTELLLQLEKENISLRNIQFQLNTFLDTFLKIQDNNVKKLSLGLHLSSTELLKYRQGDDSQLKNYLVGASVHSNTEIEIGLENKLDYLILGTVQPSMTHPSKKPLLWSKFAELTKDKPISIYAIGGMRVKDLAKAKMHGARGIAGINAFIN